jgi:hypothetical protein
LPTDDVPDESGRSEALAELLRLLSAGWRIDKIHIEYKSMPIETEKTTVTLLKGSDVALVEATDDERFFQYINHYRPLPNLSTGKVEGTYVKDIAKYLEFEEKFYNFTCGQERYLTILIPQNSLQDGDRKRIAAAIQTWIESERFLTRFPTRFARIFTDILLMHSAKGKFDCQIIEKDDCDISRIGATISSLGPTDWAYAFSCVFLCPKITAEIDRDAVILVALLDLVENRIAAACVGTIRSIMNYSERPFTKGREIFQIVENLSQKILADSIWKVVLVAPFRDSEFTPIPCITYAILLGSCREATSSLPRIKPSELILFGDAGTHRDWSSLDFKRTPQTVAVTMDGRIQNERYRWNLRFDRSPGEAKFHVDLEAFDKGDRTSYKLIAHEPVSLREIWQISENLYLAFVTAGAFDVRFDEMITKDIEDFDELLIQEPLAVYPLIYRGLIEPTEQWLVKNPKALSLLRKFWEDEQYSPNEDERGLIGVLEENHLFESGGLTVKATWILSRSGLTSSV